MKSPANVLSNMALKIIHGVTDEGLSNIKPDIDAIAEAEVALHIMRAIAEGKKRIVIDITPS